MVMDADVPVVESGGKADFQYGNRAEFLYPPAKVRPRVARWRRSEAWRRSARCAPHSGPHKRLHHVDHEGDRGRRNLNVVIVGSPNVNPGYKLARNYFYPDIAGDYQHMFDVLKSLPCDIFPRSPRRLLRPGRKISAPESRRREPLHRSDGYKKFVAQKEQEFPQ